MQSTKCVAWAVLGLAVLSSACGSDDDDDNGSRNPGAVMCPSGTESYYDEFIAVPQCAANYDCAVNVVCRTQSQAACDVYRNSLTGVYCAQPGAAPDAAQLAQTCSMQYDALVQVFPECAQ